MNKLLVAVVLCLLWMPLVGCESAFPSDDETQLETEAQEVEMMKPFETLTFEASDGLVVTGDLYPCLNSNRYMVLFHQAGWSRGEYRESALRFVEMGYHVLAVDLRSGMAVNDVINETAKLAKDKGLPQGREDAYMDMKAAIAFVQRTYQPETVIVLGSSYSAALVLVLGNDPDYEGQIDGIIAMSPGEYVKIDGATIAEKVIGLQVPTMMTSAKGEYREWEKIAEAIGGERLSIYKPEADGAHGAEALWTETEGSEDYFEAIKVFLNQF